MRIVHLSTHDIKGGAARAAYRLHTGLRRLGHDSTMFVANQHSDDQTVSVFYPSTNLPSRFRRRLRRDRIARDFRRYRTSLSIRCELFSDDRSQFGLDVVRQLPQCDVINLHWIARFIDSPSFFAALPGTIPVVWTLHDMNPFSGGCHYDDGCGRFVNGCGRCPHLSSTDPFDLSRKIWERKQFVFNSLDPARLHIVTPCAWMADQVKKSSLLSRFSVTVIPYGINTEDFAFRDRHLSREVLGIPPDAHVLLFAAEIPTLTRKGFALLADALEGLIEMRNLIVVSIGRGKPVVDSRIHHLHLGFVSNDRWLSLIYSAADLFVIPSIQDNLPNTVLESMACGTPVIGFAVGGIPDMVRRGATGLLVPAADPMALRDAIADLLNHPDRRESMAVDCRRIAVQEYSDKVQANRYAGLYESLLHYRLGEGLR